MTADKRERRRARRMAERQVIQNFSKDARLRMTSGQLKHMARVMVDQAISSLNNGR